MSLQPIGLDSPRKTPMKSKLNPMAAAMLTFACAHLLPTSAAQASPSLPPSNLVHVPGVERHQIGKVEVFALSDKRFLMDAARFANLPQRDWPQVMAKSFQTDPGLRGVTVYAIRQGSTVVLVNAGRDGRQGDDLGQVAENLKSAGISPDEVAAVFLTSLHADLVSGLLSRDAQRQFKNAQIYASQAAMLHWLADHNYVQAPDEHKVAFAASITSLMPYVRSGKLHSAETGVSLVRGMTVLPLAASTPGSVGYLIESEGQKLLITGEATVSDRDRRRNLTLAAKQGWMVADSHAPFPGLVRVHVKAGGTLDHAPLRAETK